MFSTPEFLRGCGYFCRVLHHSTKIYQPTCTTDPYSGTSPASPAIWKNVFYLQEQNARVGFQSVVIKEGAYFEEMAWKLWHKSVIAAQVCISSCVLGGCQGLN